jgi:hypothetical protein
MVELALVIPLLLVVVLMIVDFGRAVDYLNAENHIANLAARYAAIGTLPSSGSCASQTSLQTYITCEVSKDAPQLAGGGNFGPQSPLQVCISMGSAASNPPKVGDPVTVKLTSTYKWLPLPALGGALNFASTPLSGSATMMLENTPQVGWTTQSTPCNP